MLADELEELVRVAGLADHLKTRPLQHAGDALAQKDVVVGHDDATADGRLRFHDRLNLTPLPGSGVRLRRSWKRRRPSAVASSWPTTTSFCARASPACWSGRVFRWSARPATRTSS